MLTRLAACAVVFTAFLVSAHGQVSDGSLDPTWPGPGSYTFSGDAHVAVNQSIVTSISILGNGDVSLGGWAARSSLSYWWIGQLTPDGQFDPTFGNGDHTGRFNGCQAFDCSTTTLGNLVDVVPQPNSEYAILSESAYSTVAFAPQQAAHYSNVLVVNNVGGFLTADGGMAEQSDRMLLLAGAGQYNSTTDTTSIFGVARTDLNGNLDTSFNKTTDVNNVKFSGGALVQVSPSDQEEYVRSVLIQSDGKIVLAGYGQNGSTRLEAVRFNADGTIDSTFGSAGKVAVVWGYGSIDALVKAKLDVAGRIILVGEGTLASSNEIGMLILRLNSNGTPDDTFGTSGFVFNNDTQHCISSGANEMAEDSAGRILVGGACTQSSSSTAFMVTRLRGDTGAIDSSFGDNGYIRAFFDGSSNTDGSSNSRVTAVAFTQGGQPIVGGFCGENAGIARLTYDLIFTNGLDITPRGCLSPNCN